MILSNYFYYLLNQHFEFILKRFNDFL